MYRVILDKTVEKFLNKHKWLPIVKQFKQALETLSIEPYNNNLDVTKLTNKNWLYRLRISDYRFIYEVLDDELVVYFSDVWNRWDIYKKYK